MLTRSRYFFVALLVVVALGAAFMGAGSTTRTASADGPFIGDGLPWGCGPYWGTYGCINSPYFCDPTNATSQAFGYGCGFPFFCNPFYDGGVGFGFGCGFLQGCGSNYAYLFGYGGYGGFGGYGHMGSGYGCAFLYGCAPYLGYVFGDCDGCDDYYGGYGSTYDCGYGYFYPCDPYFVELYGENYCHTLYNHYGP